MEKVQKSCKDQAISGLLHAETDILRRITEQFDGGWPEFDKALEVLSRAKCRIILSGMGKSGHVARKIAATMASLGKPAHFVHPAEASHGDMGMLTKDDVLLALSNSGNTSELLPIVRYAVSNDIPVVGMTMGAESQLARASTAPLVLPKAGEGCSLGLAPTSSTTAQIALGDALAVGLCVQNDFTRDAFNELHPGGSLGASTKRVEDAMLTGDNIPLVSIDQRSTLIMWTMARKDFDIAGVVDDDGNLIGLIQADDVKPEYTTTAKSVIRQAEPVVSPQETVATAVARMQNKATKACLVVDGRKPVGIVRVQ
ncbi:KpsF/GutQ family sugar-phosphate isomerase [Salipiger mucosus]|uniref:Arabinose 5-phosphate isomerase n=1 Tax=Salipiger mucosus DSM 16094 TaxID=1123237 RepID=S9RIP8_9RHOB|nr:SIS domain-containing protein [Salipiger mucosus]EPX77990.1 Arabinose 5-phosphate isomerase [Salipiger mucosus DSM 16094]